MSRLRVLLKSLSSLELVMSYNVSIDAKCAEAIGRVCILWERLESSERSLLAHSMGAFKNMVMDPAILCIDFRDVLKGLQTSCFTNKPSDEWYTALRDHIIFVDNTLRPIRNDFIHGTWITGERGTWLLKVSPKVLRPQSRQIELRSMQDAKVLPAIFDNVIEAILGELEFITSITRTFLFPSEENFEELRTGLPPRTLLHPLQEKANPQSSA